jgi:hypothetical protein
LRPTARLSGFLFDGGRQLHGARRWHTVGSLCERFQVSGFGCGVSV